MLKKEKIYFPNLNGLRFIAAFMVIIHHLEQIKFVLGLKNYWDNSFVLVIGKLGVILFFVLSGFLITYLLLSEEKFYKKISVKQFYVRRILRIWPLYFFVILMGFFVLPEIDFLSYGYDYTNNLMIKFGFFVFMLPNLALAMGAAVPFVAHLWSIGTEEQFYLVWPIFMKKIKNKMGLMFFVILFLIQMKTVNSAIIDTLYTYWNHFNIDCMAIGGVMALLLFYNKSKILKILYSTAVQIFNIALIIVFISFGVKIPFFHYEFYAILFSVLILNIASNSKNIIKLENCLFNYLGKISYGIYMYHAVSIIIAIKILQIIKVENFVIQLVTATSFTLILASLSYELFEKRFLKFKRKFSKIVSGDFATKTSKI